jgi:hypothetical protein
VRRAGTAPVPRALPTKIVAVDDAGIEWLPGLSGEIHPQAGATVTRRRPSATLSDREGPRPVQQDGAATATTDGDGRPLRPPRPARDDPSQSEWRAEEEDR